MLILYFFLAIILHAAAQYPWIQEGNSLTYGQCAVNADCLIYTTVYPSLTAADIFCNAQVGRCQTLSGDILSPAFNALCPSIVIQSIAFPSLDSYPPRVDGMYIVNISSTLATGRVDGALRLFSGTISSATSNTSIQYPFLEEQYTNSASLSATALYYFRNLAPGAYTFQYYDISGCIVTYYPQLITVAMNGSYLPMISCNSPSCVGSGVSWDDDNGFVYVPSWQQTPRSTYFGFGVGVRAGILTSRWSSANVHDNNTTDTGLGQRVPFAQVFDISGGLLATVSGSALIWGGGGNLGGVTYPLNAQQIPTIIATQLEAMYLSGFISIVMGFGYAYSPSYLNVDPLINPAGGWPYYVQTPNGVYEGYTTTPIILDCTATAYMNFTIPPYDVGPMHFALNGIFTNTQFMYSDDDIFPTPGELDYYPTINIIQIGTNQTLTVNSLCPSATNDGSGAEVYLNYSYFPFKSNPVQLQIMQVVMTSSGVTLAPLSPPQVITIVAMPVSLQVYVPGAYCAVLTANLFDGRGARVILQSCFQVGAAVAQLTQVRAAINPTTEPVYPYTPYAGFYTNITGTFYVGLPITMALMAGMYPQVLLSRMTPVASQEQQLLEFNGALTNVFNDPFGDLSILDYYTITNLPPYQLYTLNINPYYKGNAFTAQYRVGSVVPNEFSFARLLILYNPVYVAARRGRRLLFVEDDNDDEWSRRELLAQTQSQSQSQSQSMSRSHSASMSVVHDYNSGGHVPEPLPVGVTDQYQCASPVAAKMIEYTAVQVSITVDNAICPDTETFMNAHGIGGFPYAMANLNFSNPVYQGTYPPTASSPPFTNPVAYFYSWVATSTGQIVYSGVGADRAPVPQNVLIRLNATDSVGSTATATAIAISLIPRSFMIITFLPQIPICVGGASQFVQISFILNNNNPGNIITVQPLNTTARQLYDPNVLAFDLPSQCALLQQGFTALEVYEICVSGALVNASANCTHCTNLPLPYPQVVAPQTILTNDPGFWNVIVWAITPYFNNATGRYTYCQIQESVQPIIPQPLSLIFGNPARIPSPPLCLAQNCFQASITPVVDPCYSNPATACYQGVNYQSLVILSSIPALPLINAARPGVYRITPQTTYNITAFVPPSPSASGGSMCPVQSIYIPSITGPFIELIRTTPTDCSSPSGSVVMYVTYNDPNLADVGTIAHLCMYWPNRHGTGFAVEDAVPLAFTLPIDAPTPTMLPNADFTETQRFSNIAAGTQQVLIYDRCADNTCTSCHIPNTFQLTDAALHFTYEEFTVNNLADPAGGIVIDRTAYDPATCCGDAYLFNFTFVDNAPASGNPVDAQNYAVSFFKPFSLGTIEIWSSCQAGGPRLPLGTPYGAFQLMWGPFSPQIPTCGAQGLGVSGNYTFQVVGCVSRCVASYTTYIDIVNPIQVILSSAGTTCATTPAQLVPTVAGPGYAPGQNVSLFYQYPGSSILYYSPFVFYWLTPVNPNTWIQIFLPLDVLPGNYTLRAQGPGPCYGQNSVIVTTAPPIKVKLAGYDGVCQTSNASTVLLNITGGIPPYRLLGNVTAVYTNTTINATFVQTYNNTQCYHILDSSGCITPTEFCFTVPNPGPVNLTIVVEDSCKSVATGSVSVTSDEPITCEWSVTGATQPLISSCTLTNLPVSAQLVVVASTIIGCTSTATVQIKTRPAIQMVILDRTTQGELDGPCIDNVTIMASGGELGPPYEVSLFKPPTNVTLYTYLVNTSVVVNSTTNATRNETVEMIMILGVCRSYVYTVVALESDGMCPTVVVSFDPQFSFGGSPTATLIGLTAPPPQPGPPVNPFIQPYDAAGISWDMTIVLIVLFSALMIVLAALMFAAPTAQGWSSRTQEDVYRRIN